jgi:hypothetical protein
MTLRIPPERGSSVIAEPSEVFRHLPPEAEGLPWVMWGAAWLTAFSVGLTR